MRISNKNKLPGLILLACLLLAAGLNSRVAAQAQIEPDGQCTQIPVLYQLANYTVKSITVKPFVRFIPVGSNLEQALSAAIIQSGSSGLKVNQRFDTAAVSFLENAFNQELERRMLTGSMGLIFTRYRLVNCDEQARTLEVQYRVLTVARPNYLTTTFESNDRKNKNEEAAGDLEENRQNFSLVPYAGYNRSRAMYGGADFTYESHVNAIRKIQMSASGSGSSAVAEMDFTGSKQFSSGPLSYAEWKGAYLFSNIPTNGFELQDSTVAGRLFVATRPTGAHQLFFRAGASVEGGNRQTNLPQTETPSQTLADSGYGALKLYVGASLTTSKHDWKASYALLLGNDGENLAVDYRKQIVDAAYRLRFLPREFKPFQLGAQITAGWLRSRGGFIPYGERFFGGNAEQEFIQGDSWRIRSDPFIRSFPQNRLNGSEPFPLGGDDFVSINLTVAQTIWQKELVPAEISRDPDLNAALGGQLKVARTVLREQVILGSKELKQLEAQVGCQQDAPGSGCLKPIVNRLKSLLTSLLSNAGSNDELKQTINLFFANEDGNSLADIETALDSAKLGTDSDQPATQVQSNPVETSIHQLIDDDFGDPDDPDDDALSLITGTQKRIATLEGQLTAPQFAENKTKLQEFSKDLDEAKKSLQTGRHTIDLLRAYDEKEIQPAINALRQPSASNRTLHAIALNVQALLKPELDKVKGELEQLNTRLSQLAETDSAVAEIRKNREALLRYRDLLDAADTYADKARRSYESAEEFFEKKDFYEAKNDLEQINVGFGGLLSFVSGLALTVRDLGPILDDRGLSALKSQLNADVREAQIIQKNVKSAYAKMRPPAAEAEANETVSYVGRVLGVFFREANLVAVSPVLMFDAARLRVAEVPDTNRFRYGIGGGVRFSLINVDFTAGYSINPNRRLNEPRGALVLRMDINDLFR